MEEADQNRCRKEEEKGKSRQPPPEDVLKDRVGKMKIPATQSA